MNSIPRGFRAAATYAGISDNTAKADLALIVSDYPCSAIGAFTKNIVKAAPVILSKKHLMNHTARAILVNSGCANAATGSRGFLDATHAASAAARALLLKPSDILLASTGVIGTRIPARAMTRGIRKLVRSIARDPDSRSFAAVARAIMTTDTVPKIATHSFSINGTSIRFWGCAKGSGMIHPNMATMLAFILTDAPLTFPAMRTMFKPIVNATFNRLSVDGDTSTNDTVFLLANGCAGGRRISRSPSFLRRVRDAVGAVADQLARMIAADGEGASKLITIQVEQAETERDAHVIAQTIATSPLVKTAWYGCDPNWGRIIAAMGRSGIPFKPERVDIYYGPIAVCRRGVEASFKESDVIKLMKQKELLVRIIVRQGRACIRYRTCDMTEEYIRINAHYRT